MRIRNKIAVASIILIVALVIGLFAFYWDSSIQTPKKAIEASITGFTVDWGNLSTIVGVTTVISFNITIKNIGTEIISGMSVKLATLSNGTATQIEDSSLYNYGYNFTLAKGETTSKIVDFFVNLDIVQQMHESNQNFLVTLISNSTILDERKLF